MFAQNCDHYSILATNCLSLIHDCFKAHSIVGEKSGTSFSTDIRFLSSLHRFCLSTSTVSSFILLGSKLNAIVLDRLEAEEASAFGSSDGSNDAQSYDNKRKLW